MEVEKLIIFGLVNFVMACLSGASGGGGALVSTPLLVLLGLSPVSAIASLKFAGLGISIGTSARFYREKITDKKLVIIFSVFGAIGAVFGSSLLIKFQNQQDLIQSLMGYVIIFVGIPMLYLRDIGQKAQQRSRPVKGIGLFLLFVGIIFQSAIGSGLGALQMIILMGCFGMTALVASATKRAMQLTVAIITTIIFTAAGFVDYKFAAVAFITALVGGYIGAHIALKKGDKFIVNMFAIISLVLALQLIFE